MVQFTPSYHLQLCSNMGHCWKHVIKCLFSLLIDCKFNLIPFVVFPWLSVILELGLCLLWLNAALFHLCPMILCWDLTNLALATPILIGGPVLYQLEYVVGTISRPIYLVLIMHILNLLLWTPLARRLTVVQLLGSNLSIRLSLLMP